MELSSHIAGTSLRGFHREITWPVTEKLEEFLEPGLLPAEISATKVHYTEHIEFYRPVRPGGLKRSVLFKVSLF